jgi:aryl-alcohol dehydrogenase-like predicted oxidoreductase
MRYRRLGRSGLAVSVVGLGCNNFGSRIPDADAARVVNAAMDVGITLFDVADSYGRPDIGSAEVALGKALAGRRSEVLVATKFGSDVGDLNGPAWDSRASRRYVRGAVQSSLRRLGTDWIDLYQLHKPDPLTPIEETLSVLDDLIREGLVRYIGSSNLAGWQITDADWVARTGGFEPFVSAQNHYSLLERGIEAEVVPACEHAGVGLLPYFPLANGMLTGKYTRGREPAEGTRLAAARSYLTEERFDIVERLQAFASARGVTLLDVAIGGLAAQPAVSSVIAGATTADQVRANAAAGQWEPEPPDLAELDVIAPGAAAGST